MNIGENKMKNKENKPENKNLFTRGLVVILILFVVAVIVSAFWFSSEKLVISAPIVVLICILVVLALAETFDNFNIGNILSLKREQEKTEKELRYTEQENRELRSQLTSIVSNINSNHNTTIFGNTSDLLRALDVEKAEKEEIERKKQEEHSSQQVETIDQHKPTNYAIRRQALEKMEEFLLSQFCSKYDIEPKEVFREMKFSTGFVDSDPIMERNVIFDAYYKAPWQEELFIEICFRYNSPAMLDRFYHLLSKVYHYRSVKKLQAKLVLIIPKMSEKMSEELGYTTRGLSKERFCEYFAPALKNNLLEIIEIQIDDVELEKTSEKQ